MIRLLIADDEVLEREALADIVARRFEHEITIETAENGRKAADTAVLWGADLILSGHYHGGVLRFSRHVGAISSQFIPFPKYCCGDFYKNGKCMIVSAGLGEHTVPLRIHNPRELIFIEMKP